MAICEISGAQEGHRSWQGANVWPLGKDEDATSWGWSSWFNMIQLFFSKIHLTSPNGWVMARNFSTRDNLAWQIYLGGAYTDGFNEETEKDFFMMGRFQWLCSMSEPVIQGSCLLCCLPSFWVLVLEYSVGQNIWNQHWQSRIIPGVPWVCRVSIIVYRWCLCMLHPLVYTM